MSFIAELRRRHVVRVVLVYGAVAFAVLQVADILAPALRLPEWTMTLVVVLLALGFPLAVVIAWAFEVTPEGVRRTEPAEAQPARTAPRSAAWLSPRTVLSAAGLVVLGIGVGWLLKPRGVSEPGGMPSLAVLPFENVGEQAANAAFAIGLHDDLLTQLSKIEGLRLTSRTSVRDYPRSNKNVRQIADELGVGNILEGSVQRDAHQIRINVQLIEGTTDRHLWAETYDKDLTVANVFAIQAEIATAIARALRAEFTGEAQKEVARPPTSNFDAYEAYLRGLGRGYWDSQPVAAVAFEEATRLDPAFAEAWAGAARARTWLARLAFSAGDLQRGNADVERARVAVMRAAELAPDASATKLAQGYLAYYVDWNLESALASFRDVQRVTPTSSEVIVAIGQVQRRLGNWEDALAQFEQAMTLDPRNPDPPQEIAQTELYRGHFDETIRAARIALDLRPGWAEGIALIPSAMIGKGDTTGLRAFFRQSPPLLDEETYGGPDRMLLLTHDAATMEKRLREVRANPERRSHAFTYWAAARWAHRLGKADVQRLYADSLLAEVGERDTQLASAADARVRSDLSRLRAIAYAYRGDAAAAVRNARHAVELIPFEMDAVEGWVAREALLEVLIVTGRLDEAVEFARAMIRPPSHWTIARLRTDPLTAPLRSQPAFRALVDG